MSIIKYFHFLHTFTNCAEQMMLFIAALEDVIDDEIDKRR